MNAASSAIIDEAPESQDRLVGDSIAMHSVRARVRAAARSTATVLVTGETGTGKGVVARAIHRASARAPAPFVHLDCAGLAAGTIESELFGHERGAFTGAHALRRGRLELASEGTLFLDEVGELDLRFQVKFLRLLQERAFERVGGNHTQRLHARVVAATNRDLAAEVRAGRFRADLFYRLDVLPVHVPPLRERPQDLEPLARHGCARIARELERTPPQLTQDFLDGLRRHTWPGNVRELMNVLERCLVGTERTCLTGRDLCDALDIRHRSVSISQPPAPTRASDRPDRDCDHDHDGDREHERQRIADTLRETGGNVSRAARRLAISRSTLRYRINAYGLLDCIPRD